MILALRKLEDKMINERMGPMLSKLDEVLKEMKKHTTLLEEINKKLDAK